MIKRKSLGRLIALVLLLVSAGKVYNQNSYTLNSAQKNEDCTKGSAGIEVLGLQLNDVLSVAWSHGPTGSIVNDLNAGDYSAHIIIKTNGDTINKVDTTIVFAITKEKCKVGVANHFTPNGDNYNDVWQITNWQFYPNFELYVFNKWGQEVHSQKGNYTHWDGKWNGINVPDGTYYYVFYYDGGNKNDLIKGDVTILR